nr:MAG TPA: hypothetical protein [Caudoviricetes sp.]
MTAFTSVEGEPWRSLRNLGEPWEPVRQGTGDGTATDRDRPGPAR